MKPVSGTSEKEVPARAMRPKVLNSDDLFGMANELVIDHRGQAYRLRITNLGKLILTK